MAPQATACDRLRLEEAVREQELPGSSDVAALASFLMTTLMGMSLEARNGATRDDLLRIGTTALRAWPPLDRAS
jgi:hypothetical protein